MHCATCAVTIGKVLRKQSGIISANVNYATEKLLSSLIPPKLLSKNLPSYR